VNLFRNSLGTVASLALAVLLIAPAAEASRSGLPAALAPVLGAPATPDQILEAELTEPPERLRLFDDLRLPERPLELVEARKTASGSSTYTLGLNVWQTGDLSQECSGLSFQGLWTDPVTGIAYARNRWYDARTASWLSEDPMGAVDSPNLYAFVAWGPHAYTDPMGDCRVEDCVAYAIGAYQKGKELGSQAIEMAGDLWSNRGTYAAGVAKSAGGFVLGLADTAEGGKFSGKLAAVDAFLGTEGDLVDRADAAWGAYGDQRRRVRSFGLSDVRSVEDLKDWAGEGFGSKQVSEGTDKLTTGIMELNLDQIIEGGGEAVEGGSKIFTTLGGATAGLRGLAGGGSSGGKFTLFGDTSSMSGRLSSWWRGVTQNRYPGEALGRFLPRFEGIYRFKSGNGSQWYVGQSSHLLRRLYQHGRYGNLRLRKVFSLRLKRVTGGKTAREVQEHLKIQEMTGGVPARFSDRVLNKKDPIGPNRHYLLEDD